MAQSLNLEDIKKLVIIALVSDDYLLEKLVLKGGNAIDLLHPPHSGKLSRASYDLDFSMEDDFDEDLAEIVQRISNTLEATFAEHGLKMFEYKFSSKPKTMTSEALKEFWGGYHIELKLITVEEFDRLKGDMGSIRMRAIKIRPNQSPKIEIEISKYEYVAQKMQMDLDGYTIYIYTPQMIAFEKLRAICQQLPAYAEIIPSHSPRPRARDFYDIHLIREQHAFEIDTPEAKALIAAIFKVKHVPLSFIREIRAHAGVHRQDWQNVLDTLPASEKATVQPFEYYLEFVERTFGGLTFQ